MDRGKELINLELKKYGCDEKLAVEKKIKEFENMLDDDKLFQEKFVNEVEKYDYPIREVNIYKGHNHQECRILRKLDKYSYKGITLKFNGSDYAPCFLNGSW